jgi:hypothetical protein
MPAYEIIEVTSLDKAVLFVNTTVGQEDQKL